MQLLASTFIQEDMHQSNAGKWVAKLLDPVGDHEASLILYNMWISRCRLLSSCFLGGIPPLLPFFMDPCHITMPQWGGPKHLGGGRGLTHNPCMKHNPCTPYIVPCTYCKGWVYIQWNEILIQGQHFQVEFVDAEVYGYPRLVLITMFLCRRYDECNAQYPPHTVYLTSNLLTQCRDLIGTKMTLNFLPWLLEDVLQVPMSMWVTRAVDRESQTAP